MIMIIIIIIIINYDHARRKNKGRLLEIKIWNCVRLKKEEREDLNILGCRK